MKKLASKKSGKSKTTIVRRASRQPKVSLRALRADLKRQDKVKAKSKQPVKQKSATLPIVLEVPPEMLKPPAPPQPKLLLKAGQLVVFRNPKLSVDIGRVMTDVFENVFGDTAVPPASVTLWLGKLPTGEAITKSVAYAEIGKE